MIERRFLTGPCAGVRSESRASAPTGAVIVGYGAVYYDGTPGTEYQLTADAVERIAHGAFDRAVRERFDIRCLFNHNDDFILGRTSAGTMRVFADRRGLRYEVTPPDTEFARHVIEAIRRGDVSGSSFGFARAVDRWTKAGPGDGRRVRTITDFGMILDASPVAFPAYTGTTTGMGSAGGPRSAPSLADSGLAARLNSYRTRARLCEIQSQQ